MLSVDAAETVIPPICRPQNRVMQREHREYRRRRREHSGAGGGLCLQRTLSDSILQRKLFRQSVQVSAAGDE